MLTKSPRSGHPRHTVTSQQLPSSGAGRSHLGGRNVPSRQLCLLECIETDASRYAPPRISSCFPSCLSPRLRSFVGGCAKDRVPAFRAPWRREPRPCGHGSQRLAALLPPETSRDAPAVTFTAPPGPPATLLHEIFKAMWCELLFCRKSVKWVQQCSRAASCSKKSRYFVHVSLATVFGE